MKIYIAGKMRGLPLNNFPAFHRAEHELSKLYPDAEIINPAKLDEDAGFCGDHEADGDFMREAMRRDTSAICDCTHVALMDGWRKSHGATAEAQLAIALGLRFLVEQAGPRNAWSEVELVGLEQPPPTETILEEAQRITSGDRDRQYGHPRLHWSRTVGAINAMFGTSFEPHEWGYCMILDKLAREQNGHKRDNLTDCAGYARCVERCLEVE